MDGECPLRGDQNYHELRMNREPFSYSLIAYPQQSACIVVDGSFCEQSRFTPEDGISGQKSRTHPERGTADHQGPISKTGERGRSTELAGNSSSREFALLSHVAFSWGETIDLPSVKTHMNHQPEVNDKSAMPVRTHLIDHEQGRYMDCHTRYWTSHL